MLKQKLNTKTSIIPAFFFIVFWCFLFSTALFAGDHDRIGQPILIFENDFTPTGASLWASGGAGIANPSNAEALLYNPAWRAKAKNMLLFGGLRQFEKTIYSSQDSKIKISDLWILPSYLLIAHHFKQGLIFLGYQSIYRYKQKFIFEIRTSDYPEGSGEFLTNVENQSLQNFFIGFNRPLLTHFNVGLNLGLLRHSFKGEIGQIKIDSKNNYSYAFSLGLNYEMNDRVQMSLIYRYIDPLKYKFKLEAPRVSGDSDSIEYFVTESERPIRLPWFLDLGFYFQPSHLMQLTFKIEYQEWKKISKAYDNRLQLALGATIIPNEKWRLNFGAFTSGQYPDKDRGMEDTPFVSAGIDYRLKSGLLLSISALSNTFFVKKINDNAKQIGRSQILFGMQWAFE